MRIAMSIIHAKQSYYYEFSETESIQVCSTTPADLIIPGLPSPFLISYKHGLIRIKLDNTEELTTSLDRFVVINYDAQLAVYFTISDSSIHKIHLPRVGVLDFGRSRKQESDVSSNQIIIDLPFISAIHFSIVTNNDSL